jgi:hypothetical protein
MVVYIIIYRRKYNDVQLKRIIKSKNYRIEFVSSIVERNDVSLKKGFCKI